MDRHMRRALIALLALALLLSMSVLGGCKKDGSEPADDTSAGDNGTVEPTSPPDGDDTAGVITVTVYFSYGGEAALGVPREIPETQAVGRAAMEELLEGPSDAERTTWPLLWTQIPAGTELLGLEIKPGGVAEVDLSGEFDDGGGTYSMTARLAQVVYTLTQFSTVDSVEFYIDGQKVEVFSSEGLILDHPQTPEDYSQLVPIEA